jgi:uncharacterized membrane protein YhaH (DUF805 family)
MFSGTLARGAYARAAAIRIGAFFALSAAFPLLLDVIVSATYCASVGGACGALGILVWFYTKPLIYLFFALSFVRITVMRLRDIGLPVALAAAVPLLILGDGLFGMTFGAPWGLSFMLGSAQEVPRNLTMALACVGFLCLMRSDPWPADEPGGAQGFGYAGALAFGIVTLAAGFASLSLCCDIGTWIGGTPASVFFTTTMRHYGLWGTPALLLVALSLMIWRQHRVQAS